MSPSPSLSAPVLPLSPCPFRVFAAAAAVSAVAVVALFLVLGAVLLMLLLLLSLLLLLLSLLVLPFLLLLLHVPVWCFAVFLLFLLLWRHAAAGGQRVMVHCPLDARPGQKIRFQLPIQLSEAQLQTYSIHYSGKVMVLPLLRPPPIPAITQHGCHGGFKVAQLPPPLAFPSSSVRYTNECHIKLRATQLPPYRTPAYGTYAITAKYLMD